MSDVRVSLLEKTEQLNQAQARVLELEETIRRIRKAHDDCMPDRDWARSEMLRFAEQPVLPEDRDENYVPPALNVIGPVTITDVNVLDALPDRSAVRDKDGDIWAYEKGLWHSPAYASHGSEWIAKRYGPVELLHRGDV